MSSAITDKVVSSAMTDKGRATVVRLEVAPSATIEVAPAGATASDDSATTAKQLRARRDNIPSQALQTPALWQSRMEPRMEASMKRKVLAIGMIVVVALLSVPIAPALASELSIGQAPDGFQALSRLPDARRVELTAMTDEQLSAVEGSAFFCTVCINAARIRQSNRAVFSLNTLQSNTALVFQRN
jgi:hypothetical protein